MGRGGQGKAASVGRVGAVRSGAVRSGAVREVVRCGSGGHSLRHAVLPVKWVKASCTKQEPAPRWATCRHTKARGHRSERQRKRACHALPHTHWCAGIERRTPAHTHHHGLWLLLLLLLAACCCVHRLSTWGLLSGVQKTPRPRLRGSPGRAVSAILTRAATPLSLSLRVLANE